MEEVHLQDHRVLVRAEVGQPCLDLLLEDFVLGGDDAAGGGEGDGEDDGGAVGGAGAILDKFSVLSLRIQCPWAYMKFLRLARGLDSDEMGSLQTPLIWPAARGATATRLVKRDLIETIVKF